MKAILVPTDFSNTACLAHEYAKAVAKIFDSEIMAIHSYSIPQLESTIPSGIRDSIKQSEISSAEIQFKDFFCARPNQKSDEDVAVRLKESYTILEGSPVETILNCSKLDEVEMVAMGTKGSHNLIEKVFGSVTTGVIEQCNKPVLVIPENATFSEIKNIAYATNYEPGDEDFIEFIEMFSRKTKANTHFVHVNTKKKDHLVKGEKTTGRHVHLDMGFVSFSEVSGDSIIKSLEHFIEEEKIDILALFIPHRNFWDRMFHQSVTKQMVFKSKIPLLIFQA